MKWFLVVNSDRVILAVYGSALENEARTKRDELATQGTVELVHVLSTRRPHVGERIADAIEQGWVS